MLPLQLEFGPNAFLPKRCHSQHMQSLGARKPQLEEKGFNTLKTLEKNRFFFLCEVLFSMSCMLICCRCSDAGPDRQGRVPYQMPAVLLTQAFALPGVIAQADGTDLQLGRPSPFRVTRALCLLLQRAIAASSTVARASWKCLKFMTPSQETWAC